MYDNMATSLKRQQLLDESPPPPPTLSRSPLVPYALDDEVELSDHMASPVVIADSDDDDDGDSNVEAEDLSPRPGMMEEKMRQLAAPPTIQEHWRFFHATKGLTRQMRARLQTTASDFKVALDRQYDKITGHHADKKRNRCFLAVCLLSTLLIMLTVVLLTQLWHLGRGDLPSTSFPAKQAEELQRLMRNAEVLVGGTDLVPAYSATFRDLDTNTRYILTKGLFSDTRLRVDAVKITYNTTTMTEAVSSNTDANNMIDWTAWGTRYQFMQGTWEQTIYAPTVSVVNVPWGDDVQYSSFHGVTLESNWRVVITSSATLDGPGPNAITPPLQPYLNIYNTTLLESDVTRDAEFATSFFSHMQRHQLSLQPASVLKEWMKDIQRLYQLLSVNTDSAQFTFCSIFAAGTIVTNVGVFLGKGCADTNSNDTLPTTASLLATSALLYHMGQTRFIRDLCYAGPPGWNKVCLELVKCERNNTQDTLSSGQTPCTCLFQLYARLSNDLLSICGPCQPGSGTEPCMCWVKAYMFRQLLRIMPCEGLGNCLVQTARIPASVSKVCYEKEGCGSVLQLADQPLTQPCLTMYGALAAVPTFLPLSSIMV